MRDDANEDDDLARAWVDKAHMRDDADDGDDIAKGVTDDLACTGLADQAHMLTTLHGLELTKRTCVMLPMTVTTLHGLEVTKRTCAMK